MDNKWPVIAARAGVKVGVVSAIAWALLDYASQHSVRGTVGDFDAEIYAAYSGFPESDILAVIQAMKDKGIIVNGKLSNWDKRQPKREDETSTQRVREWREMKRNETQRNAAKLQDKDEDTDKDSDTDTDTEKEKEKDNDSVVLSVSSHFSSFSLEGELTPILIEHFTEQAQRYGTEKVLGYLGYAEKEGFSWGKARAADVKKGMVKAWEIRE